MVLPYEPSEPHAQITIDSQYLHTLRAKLKGQVVGPGDADYDTARLTRDTFNIDQHPALVVFPTNTADVSVAVTFAREQKLPIAVQSGGHGHPGPADGALVINFAHMAAISIDPEAATARIEPGVLSRDLVQAVHAFGLAFPNGFAATVGVIGYVLGGGTGWFSRQYGPGAGRVRWMEVVTLDGQVLHVDKSNHPDLFWGMRGAGANFGIVTALELELYPVKELFGGQVIYPIAEGKRVVNEYLQWVKTVPDELAASLRIMHLPPVPELPEILRGKSVVMIMACYNGDASTGEEWLRPMRTVATPILDTFASMPYSQIATIANDPTEDPPARLDPTTASFNEILPEDVDAIFATASDPAAGIWIVEIRHVGGGAYAQLSEESMSFHYSANLLMFLVAVAPTWEELEVGSRSIKALLQALQPRTAGELLLNAIFARDASFEHVRAGFPPASYKRLVALKDQYDPDNVLRFNWNIPPSSAISQ